MNLIKTFLRNKTPKLHSVTCSCIVELYEKLKHIRRFPSTVFSAVYMYLYIMKRGAAKLRRAGGAQRSFLRG